MNYKILINVIKKRAMSFENFWEKFKGWVHELPER